MFHLVEIGDRLQNVFGALRRQAGVRKQRTVFGINIALVDAARP